MTTCKECVWWTDPQAEDESQRRPDGFAACTNPHFLAAYGGDDREYQSDYFCYEDDEGWGFFTGPDFGCIHATRKDAA